MSQRFPLLVIAALCCPSAAASAESLRLDDCVTIALQKSEVVRAAGMGADIARHERDSMFWRFFPSMKTVAAYVGLAYSPAGDGISIKLPDMGLPITLPSALNANLVMPSQVGVVGITAMQPLTQLWAIANGYKAKDVAAEIEVIKRALTEEQLAAKTAEYYYSYLMLVQVEETLKEAQKQLERYRVTAQSFVDVQMTDTRPLLKIRLESSRIEREKASTEGGLVTVKAALAALMDRQRDDFTLAPEEPEGLCRISEKDFIEMQRSRRKDFVLLEKRDKALDYARKAALQPFIPSLSLAAGYAYNWGVNVGSDTVSMTLNNNTLTKNWEMKADLPKGVAFFGGILTWNIGLDWVREYHDYKKAEIEAERARLEAEETRKQMKVQATKLFSDLQVKGREIELAKSEVAAAAENLRIEEEKFATTMTTQTDLLAAHLQLRQARTSLISARYQYRIALHQIAATTGVPVATLLGK
jgi:outer membrane protein TolC